MKDTLVPSFSCTLNAGPVAVSTLFQEPTTQPLFITSTDQHFTTNKAADSKLTRKRKREFNSTQNPSKTITCENSTEFKKNNEEEEVEYTSSELDHPSYHTQIAPVCHNTNLLQPNTDLRTNNSIIYSIPPQCPLAFPLSSRMRHAQRPVTQNQNEIQICSPSSKSPTTCQSSLPPDTITIDMNNIDAQNQDSKMSVFKLYISLTCFFVVVMSCGLFAATLPRFLRPIVMESYRMSTVAEVDHDNIEDELLSKYTTGRTLRSALKMEVAVVFDEVEQAVPISMDDVYLDEIRSIGGDK